MPFACFQYAISTEYVWIIPCTNRTPPCYIRRNDQNNYNNERWNAIRKGEWMAYGFWLVAYSFFEAIAQRWIHLSIKSRSSWLGICEASIVRVNKKVDDCLFVASRGLRERCLPKRLVGKIILKSNLLLLFVFGRGGEGDDFKYSLIVRIGRNQLNLGGTGVFFS